MAASVPVPAFLSSFTQYLAQNIFPSHWLLSYITIVGTMDNGEKGMNPVAMAIINPWSRYIGGAWIEPATSRSQVLWATS